MSRPLSRKVNEVKAAIMKAVYELYEAKGKLDQLASYAYVDEKRDARLRKKAGFKPKSRAKK